MRGNELQFRRMFRVFRRVFEALLDELEPFLHDGRSRNSQQNVPACLKLGVALYYMAHGGDAIHLEAASGLSKANALKYVHEAALSPRGEVTLFLCCEVALSRRGKVALSPRGTVVLSPRGEVALSPRGDSPRGEVALSLCCEVALSRRGEVALSPRGEVALSPRLRRCALSERAARLRSPA